VAETRRGVALLVVLPVLAIYAMLAATVGRFNLEWSDSRPGSEAARRALAGMPPGAPIVLVGSYGDCAYTAAFDWPGRTEWKLVPPSRSSALPVVERIDDHTILAVAESGFAMPVEKATPSPPWASASYGATVRQTAVPVEAVRSGRQRLDGALVEVVSRRASEIRGLRFRLDRPLKDYIFLFAAGCGAMESRAGADLPEVTAAEASRTPTG
jgi:hypothetical protein